ncbi:hypothetical protein J0H58_37275 [bacterium]|nr:hypothetical protein [bacterium]
MPTTLRRGAFAAAAAVLSALAVCGPSLLAQEKAAPPAGAQVFVYPEKLTAKDHLAFAQKGLPIKITGETTLVWVDLMPGARFAHPTECVLISAEGTRVVKGDWWLVLNGKDLFRDGKAYAVGFPNQLAGK